LSSEQRTETIYSGISRLTAGLFWRKIIFLKYLSGKIRIFPYVSPDRAMPD
jgi:hypothetical protein